MCEVISLFASGPNIAHVPSQQPDTRATPSGVLALMVSTFFSWAGFFLLIPLVAVPYVDDIHWAAGLVGVMLAVRQFTQRGLAPLFGIICDRTGPKVLICAGQVIRAAGFGAMAYMESPSTVLLAMFLAGLGGAICSMPREVLRWPYSPPPTIANVAMPRWA